MTAIMLHKTHVIDIELGGIKGHQLTNRGSSGFHTWPAAIAPSHSASIAYSLCTPCQKASLPLQRKLVVCGCMPSITAQLSSIIKVEWQP